MFHKAAKHMAGKAYSGNNWVTEKELMEIVHLTPRELRDLRREKKIPFKKVNQKKYLYVVEDVLDAIPTYEAIE
jgi:hypothetical protein